MKLPRHAGWIALLLSMFSIYGNVLAQGGDLQTVGELIRLFTPAAEGNRTGEAVRGIAGVRQGQSGAQSFVPSARVPGNPQSGARMQFRNVLFGNNSYNIELESYPQLDEIGKALRTITQAHPSAEFVVEGHTDSTGSAEQNLELSRYRADAIVNYLVQRFNLDPRRIGVIGYGEQRPVASNDTDGGRRLNRRVEIVGR